MGNDRDFRKPKTPPVGVPVLPPVENDPERTPVDGTAAFEYRMRLVEQEIRATGDAVAETKTIMSEHAKKDEQSLSDINGSMIRVHQRLDNFHDTMIEKLIGALDVRHAAAVQVETKRATTSIDEKGAKASSKWTILTKIAVTLIALAGAGATLFVEHVLAKAL